MSTSTCRAIPVVAPASGQGKTTVACALVRLHARQGSQGKRVRVFKCRPDCAQRLHAAAREADLTIVEGVMGLFERLTTVDGISHAMWGVLSGSVTLQKRLAALGPQQLDVAGGSLHGHTFHYATGAAPLQATGRMQAAPGRKLRGEGEALYVGGTTASVGASYFHAWLVSCPAATAKLFGAPTSEG